MDNEQLRELFTSLATLAQQGPIPVQAYSVLVHNHAPEVLAEQLHQKWLADSLFANIAANIVLHVRMTNSSGLALSSRVLALLLNDYRNRLELRSRSTLMFRNNVKALFEMYTVFLRIDGCVANCLVKPMFESLNTLVDDHPECDDLEMVALLLVEHGSMLYNLNSFTIDQLIVKIRTKLCSDEPQVTSEIRKIFLHACLHNNSSSHFIVTHTNKVYDLWAWGWNELMIPECLTVGYTEVRAPEEAPRLRKKDVGKKEFGSKESIV